MALIHYKEWCPLNVPIIKAFIPTSLARLLLSDYITKSND